MAVYNPNALIELKNVNIYKEASLSSLRTSFHNFTTIKLSIFKLLRYQFIFFFLHISREITPVTTGQLMQNNRAINKTFVNHLAEGSLRGSTDNLTLSTQKINKGQIFGLKDTIIRDQCSLCYFGLHSLNLFMKNDGNRPLMCSLILTVHHYLTFLFK